MTEKIRSILCTLGVEKYILREIEYKASELYFIKKELDAKRSVKTKKCVLTVYSDFFSRDGKELTGSSSVVFGCGVSDAEIEERIKCALESSRFVRNPYYPLPPACTQKEKCEQIDTDGIALLCRDEIFSADTREDAFVNSAEIFVKYTRTRITSSEGCDSSYSTVVASGEITAQAKHPEDSELIELFECDIEDIKTLGGRCARLLSDTSARARAKKLELDGRCDVILEGVAVRELLGYTLWRASAENIYAGYSDASLGQPIPSTIPDMTLCPVEDFSEEGVRMRELELCRGAEIRSIVGTARHCHYLDTPVTGKYKKLRACSGDHSMSELTSGRVLCIKSFSDFQFDPLDGYFGGEVRLAYLYDNGKCTPVTGFSVSGSYADACESFEFSEEKYCDYTYEGPLALKIKDVRVS